MHDKLKQFLNELTDEQADKFASALEEVEHEAVYKSIAQENGTSVEAIKSAELLQDLVMEGFFDGINDLGKEDN